MELARCVKQPQIGISIPVGLCYRTRYEGLTEITAHDCSVRCELWIIVEPAAGQSQRLVGYQDDWIHALNVLQVLYSPAGFGRHSLNGCRAVAGKHIREMVETTMSENKQPNGPLSERRIVDEGGTSWRVTEMRVWDVNGRSAASLIAAHERGFRRLWDFPANWVDMADVQLAELVSKPMQKGR